MKLSYLIRVPLIALLIIFLTACEKGNGGKQEEDKPTLNVDPYYSTITFSNDGKKVTYNGVDVHPTFDVTTNQDSWYATVNPEASDWCKLEKSASSFTVSVPLEPFAAMPEPATVTVTAGDALPITFSVKWAEKERSGISIDPEIRGSISFSYDGRKLFMEGNEISSEFTVSAPQGATWGVRLKPSKSWCTYEKSGDNTFRLKAINNHRPLSPEPVEVTLFSSITSDITFTVTQNGYTGPDVYILGVEYDKEDNNSVHYWKNGARTSIATGPQAWARDITLSTDDVYIAGCITKEGDGNTSALYWKNGETVYLTDGTSSAEAFAICIDNGVVFTAGKEDGKGKYWMNGQDVSLEVPEGTDYMTITGIGIVNGDVYISGSIRKGEYQAAYWKNGEISLLNDTYTSGMYISGDDVYISGYSGKYWKNGSEVVISNQSSLVIESIYVNQNDVYLTSYNNLNTIYWKNGVPKDLGLNVLGVLPISTTGIATVGEDIHIVAYAGYNAYNMAPRYWINGVLTTLDNSSVTELAGIVIVE